MKGAPKGVEVLFFFFSANKPRYRIPVPEVLRDPQLFFSPRLKKEFTLLSFWCLLTKSRINKHPRLHNWQTQLTLSTGTQRRCFSSRRFPGLPYTAKGVARGWIKDSSRTSQKCLSSSTVLNKGSLHFLEQRT